MKKRENETTVKWLERLVGEGANEAQLNAVRAIFESEIFEKSIAAVGNKLTEY